jgi:hypothetical protein
MARLISSLLAMAALAVTANAYAADATGAIQAIDAKARTITLADGKVYVLPSNFDLAKLKVGQTIKVTFSVKVGQNIAGGIAPIEAPKDAGIVAPCD